MSANRKLIEVRIPESYLALVRRFPLRPIRSDRDYRIAGELLDELILKKQLDDGERDYLGALELLIEAYDERQFPNLPDHRPPHDRLRWLMESSNTTQSQLRRILGASQTLVSLMLRGERALSKRTITKLAQHFRIEPGFFL
jgi:HTH-type transcriptional regulator / antitoxin HigA